MFCFKDQKCACEHIQARGRLAEPQKWYPSSQGEEILPLQLPFLLAGLHSFFSQLRKQREASFPPQQPAISAGRGGFTSLPTAAGQPHRAARRMRLLAGRQHGCWDGHSQPPRPPHPLHRCLPTAELPQAPGNTQPSSRDGGSAMEKPPSSGTAEEGGGIWQLQSPWPFYWDKARSQQLGIR